ncbi:LysR family transcriptional regulator [Shinella kummerowiae]|jgi:DNA-binding transcriptional LysR family regulator|uniref:LysR family transcriptional regulator n=1 Tax=Shinella kummerowiae TaxID=417745 RepID=A0A6N8SGW4_9HYPH|nr:LysR family transcriptional regulator [Shinella kummerowiae]MXN47931.1 LysR family transcriptional regulator [Shinella kummerowiae]
MDNRAGEMEVFVLAAELKSFSAAGRKLRLSPSAVSKLVTRIEDRLGARLLVRTTRRLELTPEGELYLGRARKILSDIAETERIVAEGARVVPRGPLRVNASVGFGERYILPLVPAFLALYPEVELDLTLTDGVIDVVGERTDVAIRSGPLRDSALKARKLLESREVVIASPDYLARHGTPQHPADLAAHNCLRFNFRRSMDDWPFLAGDGQTAEAHEITGNMLVSSGAILRQLCLDGLGLGRIGRFHVEPDIAAGTLVPVLEDFNPGDIEVVHAVFAGHEHLAARIRAFIDFLVETI